MSYSAVLTFLHVLTALTLPPSFGSIAFTDDSNNTLLTTRGPSGIQMKTLPDSGKPQARQWQGEEEVDGKKLSFSMSAAMPDALDVNKKSIRDEIKRREDEFEKEGGRTMVIERGTFKIRLTVRYGWDGGVVFHESSTSPVIYYRTIAAPSALAERAKQMLINLTLSNGGDTPQQMYDRGFPSGWTYEFAGKRVKVPYPVQWASHLAVENEDGFSGTVRYSYFRSTKEGSWGMAERIPQTQESIVEIAKRPLPRVVDYNPRPQITEADIVDWDGIKLLRQRGVYGSGEFERDWMSFTARDQFWRLHTAILTKEKNTAWPVNPFPVTATGTPVVEGTWKKPAGKYVRTSEVGPGAKFTYSVWGEGEPVEKDDVITLTNTTYESTTLRIKSQGRLGFEEWDMPAVEFVPKKLKDPAFKILDIQWRREKSSWWLRARQLAKGEKGEDLIRLIEIVGTEQGGEKFVLSMVGIDNESFQASFREAVMSCKGADDVPLFSEHPEGRVGTEYVLPFHKSRVPMNGAAPIPAITFGDGHILLGGYVLENETRVFHSIEINKWGGTPHLQRVFEAVFRDQKMSKVKVVKYRLAAGGEIRAERREVKTKEGKDAFVTTFNWGDGVYTHVLQTKGLPEDAWRKNIGLQ